MKKFRKGKASKAIKTQESEEILVKEVLLKRKKRKIVNLNNIFIYINFIIVYFILFKLYRLLHEYINKINGQIHNNTSDIIDYDSIIKQHMRTSIDWPLPKEIIIKPIMFDEDLKGFLQFMKPENIYFEFGSGGSTNIASYYKLKTYSVESNVHWHEKLKNSGINAEYITVDLKVNNNIGRPGPGTTVEDYKKYIQAYKSEYNADIILIDGRFRVACALDIFSKIRKDTIVLFHDYTPRKQYHIIENYYIKVKTWNELALFFKNPNITSIPIDVYNSYLTNPDRR